MHITHPSNPFLEENHAYGKARTCSKVEKFPHFSYTFHAQKESFTAHKVLRNEGGRDTSVRTARSRAGSIERRTQPNRKLIPLRA